MSSLPFRQRYRTWGALAAAACIALALAGCATPPTDPAARQAYEKANDPLEPMNRYIHNVNVAFDDMALGPISTIYIGTVPTPYVDMVRNFLNNLRMPVTFLNSMLQGDWNNASNAAMSFFINSTAGIGGLLDIPGNFGGKPRLEDFGQTLAVWGMDSGPALTLPVIGPSNVRDTVGLGVDVLIDPLTYILSPAWSYARAGAEVVQTRADIGPQYNELRRTSIDFYVTLRSLYRQHRDAQIQNTIDKGKPLSDGSIGSAFDLGPDDAATGTVQ